VRLLIDVQAALVSLTRSVFIYDLLINNVIRFVIAAALLLTVDTSGVGN